MSSKDVEFDITLHREVNISHKKTHIWFTFCGCIIESVYFNVLQTGPIHFHCKCLNVTHLFIFLIMLQNLSVKLLN